MNKRNMSSSDFNNANQIPDFTASGVIAVIDAVLWHIATLKRKPSKEYIEKIIDHYSENYRVSKSKKKLIKSLLSSNLIQLLRKEENKFKGKILEEKKERFKSRMVERLSDEKVEETKIKAVEKEAYARIWTLETIDLKNGDIILNKEYNNIWNERENFPLLIIKNDGIKRSFVYGKGREFTPIILDLLEYILKNKGRGGDQINLLEKVWKDRKSLKKIREELSKEDPDKVHIQELLSKVRNEIDLLNKFLFKNFKSKFLSYRKGQYKLTRNFDYYFIEII